MPRSWVVQRAHYEREHYERELYERELYERERRRTTLSRS